MSSLLTFSLSVSILFLLQFYAYPLPDSLVPPVNLVTPNIKITDEDKLQIIVSILNQHVSESPKTNKSEVFYLTINNLPAIAIESFPEISKAKIILLPVVEVRQKSDLSEYLEFSEFTVDRDTVKVALIINFVGGNSSGANYEYKKVANKWRGKIKGYFAAAS